MIKVNGRNQSSKSTTDLEVFFCSFLLEAFLYFVNIEIITSL